MAVSFEKPKVLVLRKRRPEPDVAWARVQKALGAFCDLMVEDHLELPADTLATAPFEHVFVDAALGDWAAIPREPVGRCTLVLSDAAPAGEPALIAALRELPSFAIQDLSVSDMVRFLHVYLCPKRLAGVTAFSDKSSVVVGEKIQNVANLGSLADKAASYLAQLDGFVLKDRLRDLRLVLPAVLLEAFRCVESTRKEFPTVDFQFSAAANRIALNLRFDRGNLSLPALLADFREGTSMSWRQIWECSDQLLVTEHEMHGELELSVILHRVDRRPTSAPRTLLYKSVQKSARKEDYLEPPEGYQFQILSEIRLRELESVDDGEFSSDDIESGIDFGALPESTAKTLRDLLKHSRRMAEELSYKEGQFLRAQERNVELDRTVAQKRAEVLQVRKQMDGEAVAFDKAVRELNRQIKMLERAAPKPGSQSAIATFDSAELALRENVAKLDFQLRASEERYARLQEELKKEGRVITLLEGRVKAANQEVKRRDEEIFELKATMMSLRNQPEKAAAKAAEPSANAGLEKKLKDTEERAVNAEKEVRGLKLKVDSTEKNAKAVQDKADKEKNMMEEKLKQAKAKEVELRKKIDELASLLKKTKVA